MRALNAAVKYVYLFSQISAEILLVIMTILISVDVIGRFALGKSTMISDEVSGYLLVAIGFLGLAYTLKEGRHIVIELLTSKLSSARQRQLEIPVYAFCTLVMLWLTFATWEPAADRLATGQRAVSVLATPLWIPYALVPLGSAMLAFGFFVEMINKVVGWNQRDSTADPSSTAGLL